MVAVVSAPGWTGRWPDRLPPAPVLLGWLVAGHVLLKVAMFPLVVSAPPYGDEQAYANGAMALSNAVRDLFAFTSPDTAELDRNVVASGWFMPGMSILMAPVYVVFPDAGPALVRGWCALMTIALHVAVVRSLVRVLGHRWAAAYAAFPGLVPMYAFFGFGAWGDLAAGSVLALLALRLFELGRGLRHGAAPTLRDGVVLGLLAIATLYLRASTSVLLVGLGAVTLVAALVLLRGRERWRAVGAGAAGGAVFLVLLAPWALYASHVLDARVVTTTTLATSRGNSFGDPHQLCFGRCDPDSPEWFKPVRYAREVARATGTNEVEVLGEMSSYARRDVTLDSYLEDVALYLAAYSLQPAVFVDHVSTPAERNVAETAGAWTVMGTTWLVYFPVLLLVAVSLFTVVRRSLEARLLDVVVKLCIGGLLLQPFFHVAGGRYWTTAAPLWGLAAASLVVEWLVRTGRLAAPATGVVTDRDAAVETWLGRIQRLLTVAVAVVALALLLAVVVP